MKQSKRTERTFRVPERQLAHWYGAAVALISTLPLMVLSTPTVAAPGFSFEQVADFPFTWGSSATGVASEGLINYAMNDKGQVAFTTGSYILPQFLTHTSVYFWDPLTTTKTLLFSGDQDTTSAYAFAGVRASVGLNNSGLVSVYGYPTTTAAGTPVTPGTVEGLLYFQAPNLGLIGTADAGYAAPRTDQNALFMHGTLNASGQVAFFGSYYDDCRFGTTSLSGTIAIPTRNSTDPCRFPFGATTGGPVVNASGAAAYLTSIPDASGVYNLAISDFSPAPLAVKNSLIGPESDWYQNFGTLALNDRSYAAFTTRRNTLSSTSNFRVALLRPDRLAPIVLADTAAFGALADPGYDVSINNFNQILFGLTSGNSVVGGALWMITPSDPGVPLQVWSGTDFPTLSQPGSVASLPALAPGDNFTVNNHGDVIFAASYTNAAGTSRIGLFVAHPLPGLTPANPILPTPGNSLTPYGFRFVGACSAMAGTSFPSPSGASVLGSSLPCYVDPPVASGFTFNADAGSPHFASVRIPAPLPGGQETFVLQVAGQTFSLASGQVFDFTSVNANGVTNFSITGISPSENLDPTSPTAFVAGLTWVGGASAATSFTLVPIVSNTPQDVTAPTVVSNVVGTLGANGWYKGDVTVTWTVDDPDSAITSPACLPVNVSSDTTAQVATCTATSAGGTASSSVTIKRDATAPIASSSRTPVPNANGWNASNVTVHFTGSDATSGVASCSADQQLTAEGAAQSSVGTCSDMAGNVSAPTTASDINIDKTAPAVTASATPAPNGSGWNTTPVLVTFTGTDSLSMVAPDGCDTAVTLATDGGSQFATGSCRDRAGNAASATASGIRIDRTPPIAVASRTPAPNAAGWNNTNVVVNFDGTDGVTGSGLATCSTPSTLASEGAGLSASGVCSDVAGNTSAPASASGINIDKTAPVINIATPPNGAAYPVASVVNAGYICTDARSGVVSCAGPVAVGAAIDTVTTGSKSFTVAASDLAGNNASLSSLYSVTATSGDSTPPAIAPVVTGTMGDNGWYRSNVTVAWLIADAESAISNRTGCGTTTVVRDSAGATFTCSATSAGGSNSRSVTIKRDATLPTIAIQSPNDDQRYARNRNVPALYSCADAVSGIAECKGSVASGALLETATRGERSFQVTARDRAGNVRSTTVEYTVR
jgi:hypothetical protein